MQFIVVSVPTFDARCTPSVGPLGETIAEAVTKWLTLRLAEETSAIPEEQEEQEARKEELREAAVFLKSHPEFIKLFSDNLEEEFSVARIPEGS